MVAPEITRKPTNKEVKEGQRARYDVTVTGLPKPELTWYLNDTELTPGGRVSFESRDVGEEYYWTIYVDKISKSDEGHMKVVAKNAAGEASATAKLNIQSKHPVHMYKYMYVCPHTNI